MEAKALTRLTKRRYVTHSGDSSYITGRRKPDVTLLTADGIFVSKLLTYTHQHFSRNKFLMYEVYSPAEASCIQQLSFNNLTAIHLSTCVVLDVDCNS